MQSTHCIIFQPTEHKPIKSKLTSLQENILYQGARATEWEKKKDGKKKEKDSFFKFFNQTKVQRIYNE